jgi:diadenosine tetraphosphate (Ap4A) HIT family hydrolase
MGVSACPLCSLDGTETLPVWAGAQLRVVRVLDVPDFPAFYRVIWNEHLAELSDLDAAQRSHCMDTVVTVEQVLRRALQPTKINLAALGNLVPHLHWHVIARFDWDSHFPQPVWGPRQRESQTSAQDRLLLPLIDLDQQVRRALSATT